MSPNLEPPFLSSLVPAGSRKPTPPPEHPSAATAIGSAIPHLPARPLTLHACYVPTPTLAALTDALILPVLRWETLRASLVAVLPPHSAALTVTASMPPSTRTAPHAPPPPLTPLPSPLLGTLWPQH